MAGVGDRRTATRLVFGATIRMEFRGANGAKDCANRKDDRLVILPQCAGHDVWLKNVRLILPRARVSIVRRKPRDKRGVDLISDALPFGRLWYGEPNAINNAISYAQFFSRSRHAVIRVYDALTND